MNTTLDCLPCLLRQVLAGARLARPGDEDFHQRNLLDWMERLARADLKRSPPELAGALYRGLAETSRLGDPYAEIKNDANRRVMAMLPRLRTMVEESEDRLAAALRLSIIGNYIDSGVAQEYDWERALLHENHVLDDGVYNEFRRLARSCGELLVLGDNAGEVGLDVVLAETLEEMGVRVTYAVRGRPILNDATMEDARLVGMDQVCEVVSSGSDIPGTAFDRCDPEFSTRLQDAPLVLSKGQGNFESLVDRLPGVFFAFKVKCRVVASRTGLPDGRSALLRP
ncbi:MAG: DUF89 domain-containing protein [Desulfovibrionaceae bacterium]